MIEIAWFDRLLAIRQALKLIAFGSFRLGKSGRLSRSERAFLKKMLSQDLPVDQMPVSEPEPQQDLPLDKALPELPDLPVDNDNNASEEVKEAMKDTLELQEDRIKASMAEIREKTRLEFIEKLPRSYKFNSFQEDLVLKYM